VRIGLGIPEKPSGYDSIIMGRIEIRMGTAESALQSLIRRAAASYTAGPAMKDAQAVCERLARDGISNTVCYWDIYADQGAQICNAYAGVLKTVSATASDCYLSIKAPALRFDIDLVRKVLDEAGRLNAIVHFDAMAPDTVDRTFALISESAKTYPRLGCTLPGRWRRRSPRCRRWPPTMTCAGCSRSTSPGWALPPCCWSWCWPGRPWTPC